MPKWTRWLAVSALVIVLDQLAKMVVSRMFDVGDSTYILPFCNLVLAHNTGAAFSFLANAGGWQRLFFSTVAVVASILLVYLLRKSGHNPLLSAALSLILGGAVGNLIDRVWSGYVVDFIQLHAAGFFWPAFNVADSAICVGAGLLIWDSLRRPSSRVPTANANQ